MGLGGFDLGRLYIALYEATPTWANRHMHAKRCQVRLHARLQQHRTASADNMTREAFACGKLLPSCGTRWRSIDRLEHLY
jgi:hypothetical protein